MAFRPYVICHMAMSIDGNTIPSEWSPTLDRGTLYEDLHDRLGGGTWLVGRVTAEEFAKGSAEPIAESPPPETFRAADCTPPFAVFLDGHGKLSWDRADIDGNHVVVVTTRSAPDGVVANWKASGLSVVFAGEAELDLERALRQLKDVFEIERILLEGGGTTNARFLEAGFIDELSVIIWPAIGRADDKSPRIVQLDSPNDHPLPVRAIQLNHVERFDDGALWLRYGIENER